MLEADFKDMLSAFNGHRVRYLVVGAHALASHGHARSTGDLDLWIDCSAANAKRVMNALKDFGAPLFDLTLDDLASEGIVFQVGIAPLRIDILTTISGVRFRSAWPRRVATTIDGIPINVIAREDLIRNKRSAGRPKDLIDVQTLEASD